jgi:fibro-slime domain-containing protein
MAAAVALLTGCAAEVVHHDDAGNKPPFGSGGAGGGAAGASGSAGAGATDGGGISTIVFPTSGFSMEQSGGYKLGDRLAFDAAVGPTQGPKVCNALAGVVRDFKGALAANAGVAEPGGHPDFEVFEGHGPTRGLVGPQLGPDKKPIYTAQCEVGAQVSTACPFGAMTTTKANFDQWYRSTDRVNIPHLVYLQLAPSAGGDGTFDSIAFFPLDGAGWGNSGKALDGTTDHNFSFTTEIHTTFKYMGGERFTFKGDDDVWVFINGKLAVDLGGLHRQEAGLVDLDQSATTLGITKGSVYPLDLFHAERHSVDSNFRIEMNFVFEDCGYVIP